MGRVKKWMAGQISGWNRDGFYREGAEKGPNFEIMNDFDSEMIKNWSNFVKTRDKETQFFSSAAEYFG
jgi:hypothetical protein